MILPSYHHEHENGHAPSISIFYLNNVINVGIAKSLRDQFEKAVSFGNVSLSSEASVREITSEEIIVSFKLISHIVTSENFLRISQFTLHSRKLISRKCRHATPFYMSTWVICESIYSQKEFRAFLKF